MRTQSYGLPKSLSAEILGSDFELRKPVQSALRSREKASVEIEKAKSSRELRYRKAVHMGGEPSFTRYNGAEELEQIKNDEEYANQMTMGTAEMDENQSVP